jgi:acetoin utilization deacetylase AcuC-like enzyme
MKNLRTGIISDVRMLQHKARYSHPECPARVKAIIKMLKEEQYLTHEQIDYVEAYDRLVTD